MGTESYDVVVGGAADEIEMLSALLRRVFG
jgi:hypothetical protein